MKVRRLPIGLLAALAAGPGFAADPAPGPEAEPATPRVSCDLLDMRTDAPRAERNGPWASPPDGAPAIRLVAGQGIGADRAGFLKVGLGPARPMPAALELGPRTVGVPPGTTALVEIAIDHLNRIVTPFRNPVVHTASQASTSIDGRAVYVATASDEPVALYISDGPGSDPTVSLTLAPRAVPPREIRLEVPGYRGGRAAGAEPGGEGAAAPARMPTPGTDVGGNQPYVERIADLLRAMAQRRLPSGYRVAKDAPVEARCIAGLKILKTQLARGPGASVLTVGVRNAGSARIAADASACTALKVQVAAVGAWPLKTLGPGQETEVFLVLQDGAGAADPADRAR